MKIFRSLFKRNNVNEHLSNKYKNVFNSPEGKEVLEDLLQFTRVNTPSFVPQQADLTAYNEGMRRVGLRILSMVEGEARKETKSLTEDSF
jgi:hypothetical protein